MVVCVCVCLHMCSCVPCPDGQYVDPDTNLCKECPADTVLPSSNSWGKESCKACGDGLKAVNKRVCKSDCHFTDKAGRHYDFTPLDGWVWTTFPCSITLGHLRDEGSGHCPCATNALYLLLFSQTFGHVFPRGEHMAGQTVETNAFWSLKMEKNASTQ